MADNSQRLENAISEALNLVPELIDGNISARDRMRLVRLFFDVAEIALDLYESETGEKLDPGK